MDNANILTEIDTYLAKTEMAPSTLGLKAINDGKAVNRLRSGKRMWPETIDKLRQFMRDNPPSEVTEASAPEAERPAA